MIYRWPHRDIIRRLLLIHAHSISPLICLSSTPATQMPSSHLLTELSKLSKSHSIVFLLAASILPGSLHLMILRSVSLFLRATSMSSISAGRSRHSLLSVSRTLLAQLILLILIVHASSCVVFLIYHFDPLGRPRSHRRRCGLIRMHPLPMVTGSLSS